MKKYKKIFLIMIFIMLMLGVTHSKAVQTTVTNMNLTDQEKHIIENPLLGPGNYGYGDSQRIITSQILYDANTNVFCREHDMSIRK